MCIEMKLWSNNSAHFALTVAVDHANIQLQASKCTNQIWDRAYARQKVKRFNFMVQRPKTYLKHGTKSFNLSLNEKKKEIKG